jgi:hypothetical protein
MIHVSDQAPTAPEDALAWAQAAMVASPRRVIFDSHAYQRMSKRRISDRSIWYAIKNATTCEVYAPERPLLTDGTSWRISGPDHEGEVTVVGVETFVDHLGRRLLIVTVF